MTKRINLLINLSMLGEKPTGLGIYALDCARIAERFKSSIIGKMPQGVSSDNIIISPASIRIGGGVRAAIARQLWMRKLKFNPGNLVYSPTHHGLPNQHGQIITILDMISLRFPRQHVPQYVFFKYFIPRLLKKSKAVFTISQTTREDIVSAYGYPAEKIFVVPCSIDSTRFFPGTVDNETPYLLMVGARYPHKNVDEVLHNSHLWKDKYRLVITSCSGKYRKALERLIDQLGIRDRVDFHDYVSGSELLRLYQGCTALVYASKWEGFGIPPLEALACGRPVIVSDIEIHREILADAALFVTLGNEASWRKALTDLADSQLISSKLRAGYRRIEYYSPANLLKSLEAALLTVEPNLERL